MSHGPLRVILFGVTLLTGAWSVERAPAALEAVRPNDNTRSAGTFSGDTLRLQLEVRAAEWRPESDSGPVLRVEAFAESGRAPEIPAPLIRVREGTVIAVVVRNTLPDSTITVRGLHSHPSARDSVVLAPGEARALTFAAGAPGTYLYRADIGKVGGAAERDVAAGAFVVDPREGSPADRVFVINIWGDQLDSTRYGNALALNGRSWPHTERIHTVVGDTVRWRVINATAREHPMHLHGTHFSLESKGHVLADTTFAPDRRRLEVTDDLRPGQTMRIAWAASHPGGWVFHCHLLFHVMAGAASVVQDEHAEHGAMSDDPQRHMAGLVLGIDAAPRPGAVAAARSAARTLDLYVQEGPRRLHAKRALGFVLQRDGNAPAPDSTEIPGTLLVLTRGEPSDVRVHNRLPEGTSVHWHGLELESYSDGVVGLGGLSGGAVTPAVAPGGTFTARLSLRRAGTFIYHTHLRDVEQLASGLYGPLIVLEPGERFDPRTDHVHTAGWDAFDETGRFLVNGDSLESPPIEAKVGEAHRLRFINVGAAGRVIFTLARERVHDGVRYSETAEWRARAKDGADLPLALQVMRPARALIDVGETYDFTFTPDQPGEWVISTPVGPKNEVWSRRIVVH